ncbi:MAG: DoxX family protein [Candidatus Poribacteria bacterium]|nr:DoxX family protein [Candidatus Poribacteria bacterium]
MTQHVATHETFTDRSASRGVQAYAPYLVPLGRALFSAIFISAAFGHFSQGTIQYAASQGVPFAGLLVPASGVLSLIGGLSVLVGFQARLGALAITAFLVPVSLTMHAFWAISDPMMAQIHQVMFMKNVSMLGAALFIAYVGAGPLSLDARRRNG